MLPAKTQHLILLRHGESELNLANKSARVFCGQFETPLTPRGREQACEAGKGLASRGDLHIRRVVSSALGRARETLELLVPFLHGPVQILADRTSLNERSLGVFEGRSEPDVFRQFPQYATDEQCRRFQNDFVQKAPGGENLTEVTERAWRAIESLLDDSEGDLLVISHGATMRCIVGKAVGLTEDQILTLHVSNAVPIVLRHHGDGKFESLEPFRFKTQ